MANVSTHWAPHYLQRANWNYIWKLKHIEGLDYFQVLLRWQSFLNSVECNFDKFFTDLIFVYLLPEQLHFVPYLLVCSLCRRTSHVKNKFFEFTETNMCFNECVRKLLQWQCIFASFPCVCTFPTSGEKIWTYYISAKEEYLICLQAHKNMIQANISGKLWIDSCWRCLPLLLSPLYSQYNLMQVRKEHRKFVVVHLFCCNAHQKNAAPQLISGCFLFFWSMADGHH